MKDEYQFMKWLCEKLTDLSKGVSYTYSARFHIVLQSTPIGHTDISVSDFINDHEDMYEEFEASKTTAQ